MFALTPAFILSSSDKHCSEFMQLRPIVAGASQKHTPISDKISFPWRAGELQGDIGVSKRSAIGERERGLNARKYTLDAF